MQQTELSLSIQNPEYIALSAFLQNAEQEYTSSHPHALLFLVGLFFHINVDSSYKQ